MSLYFIVVTKTIQEIVDVRAPYAYNLKHSIKLAKYFVIGIVRYNY